MPADTLRIAGDSLVSTADSLVAAIDSMYAAMSENDTLTIPAGEGSLTAPLALSKHVTKKTRDWNTWRPNPQRALWLALVIPGGGQIYNRKYWKLPIVYGGFVGCIYAMMWNNMMYRDYSQAYIDIMDNDPNTKSYVNFLPVGYNVDANRTRLQDLFRKKKDYYRRYRDLSIFATIGVYLLSILDAYIDAELSSFDISRDLSMKVRPSVIHNDHSTAWKGNSLMTNSYGIQCSIHF